MMLSLNGEYSLAIMWRQSVAENELQTNDALSTVLESFPDEQKAVDGRSWLPLHHFAVSLQQPNPVSY
jgi:hypothetical protein